MPTYCHFDSTDVTENDYSRNQLLGRQRRGRMLIFLTVVTKVYDKYCREKKF
jgi:hypothetical protein